MVGRKIISILLLLSFETQAADSCLNYAPKTVVISGMLEEKTFPGPPNYESVAHGDEAETGFYLKLNNPICTVGEASSPDAYPQERVAIIQLNLNQAGYKNVRQLIDRQVTLSGELYAAHTAHHHAPVIIQKVTVVARNER